MKRTFPILLPPFLALAGLTLCCLLLWNQTTRFRRGVEKTAEDVRVSLIDLDGKVVYDSTGQDLPNHSDRAEVEAVKADGKPRSIVRESETLHTAVIYHARRAGDYILRIAVPSQSVADAKRDAVYGLLAAIGTGALVVLALFLFMRRFKKRLDSLSTERDLQDQLLAEMRKLERFRRDFISNVTHEIKTPVTGILGAVEILTDESSPLEPSERAELHHVLKDQSVRLNALVDDVLALAQLERAEAERETDFVTCDVADIVQTAVNLAQPTARQAGISLTLTKTSVMRTCDPRLIESAVTNLIRNAIKHSGSPAVEVRVEGTDGRASVSVADYGIGIPLESQPRVFERFFRIDKNRSRALGGTGLGLAIVKHIAHLHGGEVMLVSEPEKGATFRLLF